MHALGLSHSLVDSEKKPAAFPENGIVVGVPIIETNDTEATLRFPVRGFGSRDNLYFRVDRQFESFLTTQSDPAIIGLIIPAMMEGKNIYIEGNVSPRLITNIKKNVIPLLSKFLPQARAVEIFANQQKAAAVNEKQKVVLMGFSNGVDSLTTLHNYFFDPDVPPSERITHFLFNDVGAHGWFGNAITKTLFEERFKEAKAVADEINIPIIKLVSNLDVFYTNLSFQMTHTIRNAAAALSVQTNGGDFYYSSAYDYTRTAVKEYPDITIIDPILVPLLSSEALQCGLAGASYSRAQKIKYISDSKIAHKHLNICVETSSNCSVCWKCARTLLTFELNGQLENFATVFDLNKYRRVRSMFIAHSYAVGPQNIQCADNIVLMKEVGYQKSLSEKLMIVLLSASYAVLRKIVAPSIRAIKSVITRKPMSNKTRFTDDALWHMNLAILSKLPSHRRP